MKVTNKETKVPRATKKGLMAILEAKGVDATIVKSLERSNIDTIKFVVGLI